MFIVDALIANFDRHGSNWGFIKKYNKYRLSPILDNGSSLALIRITERVDLNKINRMIDSIECISDVRSDFWLLLKRNRHGYSKKKDWETA